MIENDEDLAKKLAQLARFYRAMRKLWTSVDASDKQQVALWVADGGKVLETLSSVLGDVEDYTGTADLRIILNEMKAIRTLGVRRAEESERSS